MKLVNIQIKHK